MATISKWGKSSTLEVRKDALRALVSWETRRSNLDEISQGFLKYIPPLHRPFYTEITKGTMRNLLFLDFKLEQILDRPVESLTPWIRNILRLGGYQLEHTHVPKPAVVNLMVELTKHYGHPGTVKLVNGVLRRWAAGFAPTLPQSLPERLSILYSHPLWLIQRWLPRFGESNTEKLLSWNNSIPLLDLRLNTLRTNPEEFLELCRFVGIETTPTDLEESYTLKTLSPLDKIPGFKEGLFWIQGVSAQLPVHLLDPKPGEVILDLCAAPGGKTSQIAVMTHDEAKIVAVDKYPDRLKKIDENRRRLGLRSVTLLPADGENLEGTPFGSPDAVLLDAPCSATGVLRREVDARWNRSEPNILKYAETQAALLANAARIVKPGGRIVYSTCSLEPEENELVLRPFLEARPDFSLEDPLPYLPKSMLERLQARLSWIQILPYEHLLDGFFMVRIKKNAKP